MYNRYIPKGNTFERVVEQDDDVHIPNTRVFQSETAHKEQPPDPASGGNHSEEHTPHKTAHPENRDGFPFGGSSFLSGLSSLLGKGGFQNNNALSGILKSLKLDNWDTGDILLVLIILFLLLEGDNLEMIITLGLLLLMGL